MDAVLDSQMPGLEEASARLAELEASDTDAADESQQQEQRAEGADTAGAEAGKQTQTPVSKPTDTRAAEEATAAEKQRVEAEAKAAQDKANAGKTPEEIEAEKKASETRDAKGRYAKAQERLEKTWDSVNKRKGELDTREQQLTTREQQLQQREQTLQQRAQQAQPKPEEFEKASQLKADRAKGLHERADGLDARAKKLEDDGDYKGAAKLSEDAKALRKQAFKEEGNAEDLKSHADHLRKNPPPTDKDLEDKAGNDRKFYTLEAAKAHPDLAKEGSELQKAVSAELNQLWNTDRVLAGHPSVIYHVTNFVAARTAAARVPGLEEELGKLKAKVQEYEKLTALANPQTAQRQTTVNAEKTDEEERAELRDMAEAQGTIR